MADPCHLLKRNDKGGNIELQVLLMKQNSVKRDLLLFEQKLVNSGEMDQSWISVHEKHGPMSPTICQ